MAFSDTEVMTQVTALKLAQQAIDYLLTGTPAIDTFDPGELYAACHLLLDQWYAGKGKRRPPHQATLDLCRNALAKVHSLLEGDRVTGLSVGRSRAKLQAAALALPEIIVQLEWEYNAYWQWFSEAALMEAEAILAGEMQ
jgi:hypothetical protein